MACLMVVRCSSISIIDKTQAPRKRGFLIWRNEMEVVHIIQIGTNKATYKARYYIARGNTSCFWIDRKHVPESEIPADILKMFKRATKDIAGCNYILDSEL